MRQGRSHSIQCPPDPPERRAPLMAILFSRFPLTRSAWVCHNRCWEILARWAALRIGSMVRKRSTGVSTKTSLSEKVKLELRCEFYNIFNLHAFQDVNRNITNAAFG